MRNVLIVVSACLIAYARSAGLNNCPNSLTVSQYENPCGDFVVNGIDEQTYRCEAICASRGNQYKGSSNAQGSTYGGEGKWCPHAPRPSQAHINTTHHH